MTVIANLIGIDGDAFSYVNGLGNDIIRRFILHVFAKVDSKADRINEWPKEPFDCVFFAKILHQLASDPSLLQLVNDEITQSHDESKENVKNFPSQLFHLNEAMAFIGEIPEANIRSILNLSINIVVRLLCQNMFPQSRIDLYYFVQTLTDAFSRPEIVRVILRGKGRQLDWW